ncbi:UPF0223 family protein [Lentilactobacillus sp. IMAU92037]|uniref:UPF0223 family protein n=1 Tax=Lentilactobacillus TaxID=2767893 RepID=UPI001C25BEFD|nr:MULTISPECIES: UPF0223 family protein [Lentilactobacillus]MBU9788221.1 UPF0223 family protein [Lentilactobacillus dabitei]MBV0930666.1 UPF0223 family protein [Lentilactobacillus dabitei]MDM7517687.1 UPF0223 family protein [Lentilactobacillus sp. TOM.63]
MADGYEYPLIDGLDVDEVIIVVGFFQKVEEAYEQRGGVDRAELMKAYNGFRATLPAQMEQKQLEKEFLKRSGYDAYAVVKKAKASEIKTVKMDGANNGR